MTKIHLISCLIAVCGGCVACTSEYQKIQYKDVFQFACIESGGEYNIDGKRCVCSATVCDKNVICDELKECRNSIEVEQCISGNVKCMNSQIYECNEHAAWFKRADTPQKCVMYGCLFDNSGCAECNKAECRDGQIRYCLDGRYSEYENCKTGKCTDDSTACYRECENGETVCQGKILKTCIDDRYELTTCSYGCEEVDEGKTSKACVANCKENSQVCLDGQLKVCVNGTYSQIEDCSNGNSCKSDTECGDCRNGSGVCENDENEVGHSWTCELGTWGDKVCPNNASCQSDSQCGVCNNNVMTCEDDLNGIGQLTTCVGGNTHTESCPGQASCQNVSECGECKNGDVTCINGDDKVGVWNTCISGKHQKLTYCDFNYSCNSEMKCGDCKEDDTICEDVKTDFGGIIADVGHVKVCKNGVYVEKEDCISSSCDPFKTKCGDCINGQVRCSDDRSMIIACSDGELKVNECSTDKHCMVDTDYNVGCVAN